MKEIAQRVFTELPRYVPHLAAMVGAPKRTIAAHTSGAPDDLQRAIVFVGITVGLGFLLQAPTLPPESDFIMAAAAMAAFKVVAILGFSGIVWGCFRVLGGKGDYLRTLTAYIYMVSPLYLALVVLSLIALGLVRAYDPELALSIRTNPFFFVQNPEIFERFQTEAPALAYSTTTVNSIGNLLLIGWFITCLGAFRALHGVTRWRSAVAGFLIVMLWWPFNAVIIFLSIGMFGLKAPPLT